MQIYWNFDDINLTRFILEYYLEFDPCHQKQGTVIGNINVEFSINIFPASCVSQNLIYSNTVVQYEGKN
jgi:hypothetical protein